MKNELAVLELFLHNELIGTITRLPDDRIFFSFSLEYIENPVRSTLSLSFKDLMGNLIEQTKPTKTRLPHFFANVLPEGPMRNYLAARAQVNPDREFFLLAALGNDLPGAIRTGPIAYTSTTVERTQEKNVKKQGDKGTMHFSLAGLQMKFSASWEPQRKITISAQGAGGSWIVKLPSSSFLGVPQNEYAMMELARQIGIEVPKTALVPIDQIHGLPKDIEQLGSHAFIIQRFDRTQNDGAIHTEDFAQILGVYPEKKYLAASYNTIAKVVWAELGAEGLEEFIRRFVFNALIGNGDMHLKNWSLIYPDKRTPRLAPAYDYVSTLPYLPNDSLALNFEHKKAFSSLTLEQFRHLALTTDVPQKLVIDTVLETVSHFEQAWRSAGSLTIDEKLGESISAHLKTVPLWTLR